MSLTKVTLHGNLGKEIGKDWKLEVESIPEAMHAINVMTDSKLFKTIIENDKQNVKYRVLVNGKSAISKSIEKIEDAPQSELFIKRNMESLDIVPVLEGAGGGGEDSGKDWMMVMGGALTMGVGFGMESAFGATLIQLGLFAVITGLSNLLAEPPEFEDFREIDAVNKRESYLFNGPINTYNPGGPVPVGYGRLLVGSATIGFSQENIDKKIYDNGTWYP